MIDPELLKIMCCPETHQDLALAGTEVISDLNQKIGSKSLRNRAGKVIEEQIDGALVRQDGKFCYPIRHKIPIMLVDDAIPLPA